MYVQVLFLFFAYLVLIKTDTDSDEAKYIDLLPEEEKQEFLNRIAKRIAAEIKNRRHSDRTSVEISDERLNEHAAYIQKIMEEESEGLKYKRRLESEMQIEDIKNSNVDELSVKPLEKQDINVEEKSEIIDLNVNPGKKRIKKDTNEDSKQMSLENIAKIEDSPASEIPVRLLYDGDRNFNSGVTAKTTLSGEEVKENLVKSNLEVVGLKTVYAKEDEVKTDNKIKKNNEPMHIHTKENLNESNKISDTNNIKDARKSFSNVNDTDMEDSMPIDIEDISVLPKRVIGDFEPKEKNLPEEYQNVHNNNAKEESIEFKSKEKEYTHKISNWAQDEPNERVLTRSSTENILKVIHITDEATSITNIDKLIASTTGNAINVSESNSSNTKNYNLNTSQLKSQDSQNNLGKLFNWNNTDNVNDQNILKNGTETYLHPVTPVNDVGIELITNSSDVNTKMFATSSVNSSHNVLTSNEFLNDRSVKNKPIDYNASTPKGQIIEKKENEEYTSKLKPALRLGQDETEEEAEYDSSKQFSLKMKDHDMTPTKHESNINYYRVFEVSDKEPAFIPAEPMNGELVEEPHYVPVYNYAPDQVFYNPHNHFGPNFEEKDKPMKMKENIYRDTKEVNKFNELNILSNNFKSYSNKKKANGQRNFKLYSKHYGNYKPLNIAQHSNLVPVLKGKISGINPNDYLDMDYYLGRANDAPEVLNNDFNRKPQTLFSKHVIWKDRSEDVIDPNASIEPYNLKTTIGDIRKTLFTKKYSAKSKPMNTYSSTLRKINSNLIKRNKITDQMLREHDETFVIFIPGREMKDSGTYDSSAKNIAADYYFSRTNSEELPAVDRSKKTKTLTENVFHKQTVIQDTETTEKVKSIINVKQTKGNVEYEKRLQIPLKPDNILKIDLALEDRNKVNVIFKKVKKPEGNTFDDYLNACLDVLKDMIEYDNKGLLLYDWLGSTVDTQSAIHKLLDLTNDLQAHEQVHFSDFELIKYILYVFESSNISLEENKDHRSRNNLMEKDILRKTIKPKITNNKSGVNVVSPLQTWSKIYKYIKEMQELNINMSEDLMLEFEDFLTDLQDSLIELHDAIKQIATVTKFNDQSWFHDLKDLYLSPVNRDVSLRLLLHVAASRLFGLIEDSAKKGIEDNVLIYVQNHRTEVDRTRKEFIFVLRLLKEIKGLEYYYFFNYT